MSIVEMIGFLISFLALVFLSLKNKQGRPQPPLQEGDNDEQESNDPLEEFIKSFGRERSEHRPPPAPVQEINTLKKRSPPFTPNRVTKDETLPQRSKVYQSTHVPKTDPLSRLEGYHLQSSIEDRQLKSKIEARKLKTNINHALAHRRLRTSPIEVLDDETVSTKPSRAAIALSQLPQLNHIIIYDTILNKPKGW